jgi:hypothetical protein
LKLMVRITSRVMGKGEGRESAVAQTGVRAFTLGTGKVAVGGEDELVEFEPVLAHGELNFMFTGGGDIEIDGMGNAAVVFFRPLFAFPVPGVFALAPLEPLAAGRPLAVEPDVKPVVLGPGRPGPDPDVIPAGIVEVNLVIKEGEAAGLVGKIFAREEGIVMGAAGVGEQLKVSAAAGSFKVRRVAIRGGGRGMMGRVQVPGPAPGQGLLVEMLGFHRHQPVDFLEDQVGPGHWPGQIGRGGEKVGSEKEWECEEKPGPVSVHE